jgi:hypothetical protein
LFMLHTGCEWTIRLFDNQEKTCIYDPSPDPVLGSQLGGGQVEV